MSHCWRPDDRDRPPAVHDPPGRSILLMEDGRIIERGTHAQLMAARGAYHGMVIRQMESQRHEGEEVLR
jgi:hypothetical protein